MVDPDSFFHVAIKVPDVDESLAFYRDLLGGEVVDRVRPGEANGPDATAVEYAALAVGDKRVYLFDRAPYEAAGLAEDVSTGFLHFGFVVDDVESAAAELRRAGAEFLMDPTDFGDLRIAFFRDPADVRIELIEEPG